MRKKKSGTSKPTQFPQNFYLKDKLILTKTLASVNLQETSLKNNTQKKNKGLALDQYSKIFPTVKNT
jgi:hypothetical protein